VAKTANDTATRRVTTGIVLAVALFAGSDSYSHIYTLARDHAQAIVSAALLPLTGDGLIAAASSAVAPLKLAFRQVTALPCPSIPLSGARPAAEAGGAVTVRFPIWEGSSLHRHQASSPSM
jgi:hypothetical protein